MPLKEEILSLLKREVTLMREILASLLQEEEALVHKDPKSLQAVMFKRDLPLQTLKEVRQEIVTKMDADAAFLLEDCEIQLLADQIVALCEQMNAQSNAISHLMEQTQPHWRELIQGVFTPQASHPSAFRAKEAKKKGVMLSVKAPEEP